MAGWRDQGFVIHAAPHGETAAIVTMMTAEHGVAAGLLRHGMSRKYRASVQIGTGVEIEWKARLEAHLGYLALDATESRAYLMADPLRLAGLSTLCALLYSSCPERLPMPQLYADSMRLLRAIGGAAAPLEWLRDYALWELALLEALGYGLDLSGCAATGRTEELVYVSPKTGRAVSRDAGAPWADRLLPLPGFLLQSAGACEGCTGDALRGALHLTGYFMEHWLAPHLRRKALPAARHRLMHLIENQLR